MNVVLVVIFDGHDFVEKYCVVNREGLLFPSFIYNASVGLERNKACKDPTSRDQKKDTRWHD